MLTQLTELARTRVDLAALRALAGSIGRPRASQDRLRERAEAPRTSQHRLRERVQAFERASRTLQGRSWLDFGRS